MPYSSHSWVAALRAVLLLSICAFGIGGRLNILTTLSFVPGEIIVGADLRADHRIESLLALAENCYEPEVSQVVVLLDRGAPETATANLRGAVTLAALRYVERRAAMRRHLNSELNATKSGRSKQQWFAANELPLPARSGAIPVEKLTATVVGAQPTYAEMLRKAGELFPGELVAVANADIVLRHAERLDAGAFDAMSTGSKAPRPPLVLALSPTVVRGAGCGDDICGKVPQGWSWDAHLFRAPLLASFDYGHLESTPPLPVFMNQMGAENRVGFALAAAGYEVLNPCEAIIAEHWHCAPKVRPNARRSKRLAVVSASRVLSCALRPRLAQAHHRQVGGRALETPIDSDPASGRPSPAAAGGGHRRRQQEKDQEPRVDTAVTDAALLAEMAAVANRWRLKKLPENTTRYFWVPRLPGGGGHRGLLSDTAPKRVAVDLYASAAREDELQSPEEEKDKENENGRGDAAFKFGAHKRQERLPRKARRRPRAGLGLVT